MDAQMNEAEILPTEGPGLLPMPAEIGIPVAALEMPDDQEKMAAPAEGDEVQFNATGKVVRIQGETAFVTLATVNGQDLPKNEPPAEALPSDDLEGPALREESGGLGRLGLMLLFCLITLTAMAATRYYGDASLRHSLTVSTRAVKLLEVRGFNNTASDLYIQVLPFGAITNGQVPIVSELAFAGLPYSIRFQQPLELDACCIAASTALATLTNTTGAGATDKVTILVQTQN